MIGGEGGWDYLTTDADARRLYVTHGTQVEVLDLDTGKKLGVVAGVSGAHGVVVASPLGRGFISSGRDSSVVAFDLRTLKPTSRIHVPARFPDAILFEPVTRRLFTFNGGSDNACAFDAATGAFVDSLPLGGKPEFAVADGAGGVFVNIESTSEIVAFDARTPGSRVVPRWRRAKSPPGSRWIANITSLFSGCSNRWMIVTDATTGRVVDSLSIGEGTDGVACDAKRYAVFSSNGQGTLTVATLGKNGRYAVAETDSTQRGARTIALDPKSGRVYVVTASFGPPPEPTAERPHPRPTIVPGTFTVLVLEP